jgi:hypothetical protein
MTGSTTHHTTSRPIRPLATVDTYSSMWNEVGRTSAGNGRSADAGPRAAATPTRCSRRTATSSWSAIVDAVQAQFPGQRFRRTTAVDAHHDVVRFGWELAARRHGHRRRHRRRHHRRDDGRFRTITGFFGDLA